jgi:ribose-phosphate pyrophosphokinase
VTALLVLAVPAVARANGDPASDYLLVQSIFLPFNAKVDPKASKELADTIRAADWVVTVDPHLHRIRSLGDVFTVPAEAVHSAPLMGEWIRTQVRMPLILGPDAESMQWVASIARLAQAPYAVLAKSRAGDRNVVVTLPDLERYAGRQPVLVDDIISSGATMAAAIRALRTAGWPAPVCLAVHALFAGGADEALRDAGAEDVITCNTVAHSSNALDVRGLLAGAVSRRLETRPAARAMS